MRLLEVTFRLIILSLSSHITSGKKCSEGIPLGEWMERAGDVNTVFPNHSGIDGNSVSAFSLVTDKDCGSLKDKKTTVSYSVKTKGGKKLNRNQPFNGYLTIRFGSGEDGLKLKTCLLPSDPNVLNVQGHFQDGSLEGLARVEFFNGTFLIGYMKKGNMAGVYRKFQDNKLVAIFDGPTTIWQKNFKEEEVISNDIRSNMKMRNQEKYVQMMLHDRKVYLASSLTQPGYVCETSEYNDYFVHCRNITEEVTIDPNTLDFRECSENFATDDSSASFSYNQVVNITVTTGVKDMHYCQDTEDKKSALTKWMKILGNRDYDPQWYDITKADSIDPNEREINLKFNWFSPCFNLHYTIINQKGFRLMDGIMINGEIKIKLDEDTNIANWNGPLEVYISKEEIKYKDSILTITPSGMADLFENALMIRFRLKQGKISGLVIMYGKVANEPHLTCITKCRQSGMGYIGHFEGGKPIGTAWRGLMGNGWIYGEVDQNGDHTGPDIAYIYNDLSLAYVGHFENGIMMDAKEAKVLEEKCNKYGIKELQFSQPQGPSFWYSQQNTTSLGDKETTPDILEQKYHKICSSDFGDGACAADDIPSGLIYANYGGHRLTESQRKQLKFDQDELIKARNESGKYTQDEVLDYYEAFWMYRLGILNKECDIVIDIPPEFIPIEKYSATLGHKVNHKFVNVNTLWATLDSPRFGLIGGMQAKRDIKAGEELSVSYGYPLSVGPRWYQKLYKEQFPSDGEDQSKENDENTVHMMP